MLTGAPDSVRHPTKTKVAKLSYSRIVALSGANMRQYENTTLCFALSCYRIFVAPNNATIRQHDSVHLTHYRVIALSGATMRRYDSARLSYYRIVGGDNATTRLYDRVGAMASLSHYTSQRYMYPRASHPLGKLRFWT